MSNAVGKTCCETGQKIQTTLDGEYCLSCKLAYHADFLGEQRKFCPNCGRKMQESMDQRLDRQREERAAREKASTTRTGRWLVLGSALACLLPFALVLLRWIVGIDKSAYDGTVKFRVSMTVIGNSAWAWCWIVSLALYAAAVGHTLFRPSRRGFARLVAGLLFAVVAYLLAYSWIIFPILREMRRASYYD